MKAIEIKIHGRIVVIPIEDRMSISINILNDICDIYACSIDYGSKNKKIWFDFEPINLGEKIDFKLIETEVFTEPIKTIQDKNICHPKESLVEQVNRLEKFLKDKGLL